MSTQVFKPGDVVVLKSGSPKMTVAFVNSEGAVWVSWYDFNTNNLKEQVKLQADTLKLSEQ
jgi:uncharacterized protein YodC (DUF2158 family)